MSRAESASIHSPSSQSAPGSEEIVENSIRSQLVTQRPHGWFMCWRSRVRLRKVLQQPGHLALGIVRWKIQEVAPRNSANPVCRLSISSKLSGKRNPSAVHSSPLATVPSPPLETPEEAISLLHLLRADHNVSLAEFSLLDCEINRCAARLQYYMHQAEKARKRIQHADHAIGYGRKVITRSGYLYEATVGCSRC
ncbi:hypothetical protein EDD15DRAFT_2201307 [Pisolithus albus]|nr:hypothetical protein EDD15DRAFT_2201307 [Pisolithus albus]